MTTAERTIGPKLAAGDKIGIVAGSGRLPINVAESLARAGHRPFIVLMEGEADRDSPLLSYEHEVLELENLASLVSLLKRRGVTHLVLAGGIGRRPDWRAIRPTWTLIKLLPKVIVALAKGDDGLLKFLVGHVEARGIKVVGAHEIVPDLLAGEGAMTRSAPQTNDWRDLDAALAAARAIGALDIGQAAVAIGGRAVALEGVEGTDGLLARVKDLRSNGRIAGVKRGVLVKCAKPGQEIRADLPAIGPATIAAAHAAGLAGIGVEAGRSLILDYQIVIQQADSLGFFVVGIGRGEQS